MVKQNTGLAQYGSAIALKSVNLNMSRYTDILPDETYRHTTIQNKLDKIRKVALKVAKSNQFWMR